jgi:O-acetyl-ADP-ribose deacetylase (regulator of RNase III)
MTNSNAWGRINLELGDITSYKVDALVNAANAELRGGGGVDGAIHCAAGPQLIDACRLLGGCPTGSAKITDAYNLPARYIIHAVGPVYRDGNSGEPELLASAYQTSFQLASDHHCQTLALSAISCGVYGYPQDAAARIALTNAYQFMSVNQHPSLATWVLFTTETMEVFKRTLAELRQMA